MAAKDLFDNDELFYLKWNNFQSNINNQFEKLRQTDDLVDITFACEGKKIGAHKLILFACSPYFKDLLQTNSQHSVFFMYGVRYEILKAIIEYMYLGEVHISNENLREFIQTAESLQIRGLTKDQAIKIPKPVIEVSASDLMGGGPDEHYDHSLKRVVKRGIGGKRMRPNEENTIANSHQMYVAHHDPIPVDMGNDGVNSNNSGIIKPDIQMPKPIDKRNPYHEEGQVEPKMELEDSVDIPTYITHQRQMESQHQQHQQQQQQQQQQQHHHHHPHQPKILQPPPPPQPQQQQPQIPPPHHIGAPNNGPPIIDVSYDRPGTSGHTGGGPPQPDVIQPIKTGYEQMSENNQTQTGGGGGGTDDDTKFKLKREGTPKLTKCQESSRACPVCSRIYSSVSNLRQHMRLIHNPTYVCCPICQKYFNTDLYLRRHISGIHRGENIDWPPPYENNQTTPNSIC